MCVNHGITLKELAEKMNVKPEAVTRAIANGSNPTLSTLTKIANALDVEITELFDTPKEDMIINGFIQVNDQIHKISSYNELKNLYNELTNINE